MRLGIMVTSKCLMQDFHACYEPDDQFRLLSQQSVTWDKCLVTFSSCHLPYGISKINTMTVGLGRFRNPIYFKKGKATRFEVKFDYEFLGRSEL